jgi:hypothetical protein
MGSAPDLKAGDGWLRHRGHDLSGWCLHGRKPLQSLRIWRGCMSTEYLRPTAPEAATRVVEKLVNATERPVVGGQAKLLRICRISNIYG